ncbi:hypothetical protein SRHO_G00165690 [Serrasalmus rhombeus]
MYGAPPNSAYQERALRCLPVLSQSAARIENSNAGRLSALCCRVEWTGLCCAVFIADLERYNLDFVRFSGIFCDFPGNRLSWT